MSLGVKSSPVRRVVGAWFLLLLSICTPLAQNFCAVWVETRVARGRSQARLRYNMSMRTPGGIDCVERVGSLWGTIHDDP